MKNINIYHIDKISETFGILKFFSPRLEILSKNNDEYIYNLAKKFVECGNVLVAKYEDTENALGFAVYYANNLTTKEAFLSMIASDDKTGIKGIGSLLLKNVINNSKKMGMKTMSLEVRKNNTAIKFYQKNGFHIAEDRGNMYFMRKDIHD